MKKIYVAPMAGVTDYTYRRIMKEFNPDLLFTEMVSVNALSRANKKTIDELLRLVEGDGVQIFGADLEIMKESVKYIESLGVKHIDVNMGCPMPKIVKNGYGSAMLEDPDHVKRVLNTLRETMDSEVDLSVKIRIGYKEAKDPLKIAKIAEEVGCKHITIHGRTKEQLYTGTANWDIIREVANNVDIPVIGNGDIFTGLDGIEKIGDSKVAGVMLARGIYGNPWLIRDVRDAFNGKVDEIKEIGYNEKIDMAIKHLEYTRVDHSGKNFHYNLRKHLCWYLKGVLYGARAKTQINKSEDYDEILDILENLRNLNKGKGNE